MRMGGPSATPAGDMQLHMTPPLSLIGCRDLEKVHLRFRPDQEPNCCPRLPSSTNSFGGEESTEPSQVVSSRADDCRAERLIRGEVGGLLNGSAQLVPLELEVKGGTHRSRGGSGPCWRPIGCTASFPRQWQPGTSGRLAGHLTGTPTSICFRGAASPLS